jgi:hydrogenase nickel incorporation protein HypB
MKQIEVKKDILSAHEEIAQENRAFFDAKGIFVLNLMSSPGAGKTTLLERTIELLKDTFSLGVIEGDIATTYDAERISRHGVQVVQINTGGACHLDGTMIKKGFAEFDDQRLDGLIIENVGNLVCPAEFNLGEDAKAMLLSVTEGEDKPLKYPLMFRLAKALVINKVDLLPYVECSIEQMVKDVKTLNPDLEIFEVSCTKRTGLGGWKEWLTEEIKHKKHKSLPDG